VENFLKIGCWKLDVGNWILNFLTSNLQLLTSILLRNKSIVKLVHYVIITDITSPDSCPHHFLCFIFIF